MKCQMPNALGKGHVTMKGKGPIREGLAFGQAQG